MAASQPTGVTTRQMLKRRENNSASNGKRECGIWDSVDVFTGKKSSPKQTRGSEKEDSLIYFGQEPGEDVSVVSDYNSRTFPLQQGEQPWSSESVFSVSKRQPKTETTSKQKRALVDRSRNGGQIQRRSTRQSDITNKTDAPLKVSTTQTSKSHRKFESKEMAVSMLTKKCFVMVSPMEVSLLTTPGIISTIVDASSTFPEVPKDVVDIDAQLDKTAPYIYSREVVQYWRELEPRHAMEPAFIMNSPDVTPRMRAVLMDWLLQVQVHEDLEDETMHLCRVLIDRVLAKGDVTMGLLQLFGITCLLIASKFCERFCTEIKTLCYLTDRTYSEEEVKKCEKNVLFDLDWDITGPVCTHFLERFLQVHQHPSEVRHMSMYLLDLSLTNIQLACVMPSKLAAAALLLARRIMLVPSDGDSVSSSRDGLGLSTHWTRALQFYTTYTESDLQEEIGEFDTILVKAPTSKFQGARKKYEMKEKCFVSVNHKIDPTSAKVF